MFSICERTQAQNFKFEGPALLITPSVVMERKTDGQLFNGEAVAVRNARAVGW